MKGPNHIDRFDNVRVLGARERTHNSIFHISKHFGGVPKQRRKIDHCFSSHGHKSHKKERKNGRKEERKEETQKKKNWLSEREIG